MKTRTFWRTSAMFTLVMLTQLASGIELNVTDFGAVGDGSTTNTSTIQKAIDACAGQGGGAVLIPAGTFVSGTLILKNGVKLRLAQGATLLGSTNIADYRLIDEFTDGRGSRMGYCFIGAQDATNIGVEGEGTIDGRGKAVLASRTRPDRGKRPFLMRFVRCSGVALQGVRLTGPAAWTTHFFQCKNVTAERVSIQSKGLGNNDGFDIDSCAGVRIYNCNVDSGDDSICLKTTSDSPCRDVDVASCTLRSNCATIKFGTESVGDFEKIRIARCRLLGAGLGGIKLLSVDGANLRDVIISDVTMESGKVALFIRLGARLKTYRAGDTPRSAGTIKNISIRNYQARAESPGIVISGIPGHAVEDVKLENIEIELPGKGKADDAEVKVPEKEKDYPEIRMFGPLPAYGLYARHLQGLKLSRVKMTVQEPDPRPAIVCQDVQGLESTEWKLPASIGETPLHFNAVLPPSNAESSTNRHSSPSIQNASSR